ncbi:stabilizer of axonemal microtubules 1-like isoform X2 [Anguilla rostrata]|uniref:stabilizer of axonemal microtubules 1-like isoform X2 n=1 Tax=Anguilla rostrata TaxID=7938 RepID=UPI0030CAC620
MAIQSFSVAGPFTPGYAFQTVTQNPYKAGERKTAERKTTGTKTPGRKTVGYSPPRDMYTTSYREEFCNWEGTKRKPFKPCDNLMRSDGAFQGITTYQVDFSYKRLAGGQTDYRPQVAKAPERQSFQGPAPYAVQHKIKPNRPSRLQGVIYAPSAAAPLDLGSALRGQRGEEPSSAPPPKPAREAVSSASRRAFAHSTEYQATFRAWPTPPVYQHAYPVYDPPRGTMDFLTSYSCDYRPWGVQTRPPIRQREEFDRPTGAFQHTTTYLADFTPKVATPTRARPAQRR